MPRVNILVAVAVATFFSSASAQSWMNDDLFADDVPHGAGATRDSCAAYAEAGGELSVTRFGSSSCRIAIQSTLLDPRSVSFLSADRFAVFWADNATGGVLEEYDYTTGALFLRSSTIVSLPMDRVSVRLGYDERADRLHLLASSGDGLVAYRFSSRLQGGTVANAFWQDGSAILSHDFIQYAGFFIDFRSIRLPGQASDHLAISMVDPYHEDVLVIDEGPSGAVIWTRESVVSRRAADYVTFARGDVKEGQLQIRVRGFEVTTGNIVSDHGGVLGSYELAIGQTESLVVLARALVIGETISLLSTGGQIFATQTVMARLGSPNTTSSGMTFYPLVPPIDHYLANESFRISSTFHAGDETPGWSLVVGAGVVGFHQRGQFGVDPIVSIPEGLILDPFTSLVVPINATVSGYTGRMRLALPTPSNASLIGQVFLYQFLMYDGSEIAISDIIGFPLLPSPL